MARCFVCGIDVDLKDPKHYAVYMGQGGLGLPDRDYYLKPDFAAPKAKYQAYVAQLLHLIDWPDADARAKDVVAFETTCGRGELDQGAAARSRRHLQSDDDCRAAKARTRLRLEEISGQRQIWRKLPA